MTPVPGHRVDARPGSVTPRLGPGEYCLDAHGRWWVRPPAGSTTVGLHPAEVLAHSDGTVTVRGRVEVPGWSGRLRRGVWEPGVEAGPTNGY